MQGCPFSSIIFNIFMECAIRIVVELECVKFNREVELQLKSDLSCKS